MTTELVAVFRSWKTN